MRRCLGVVICAAMVILGLGLVAAGCDNSCLVLGGTYIGTYSFVDGDCPVDADLDGQTVSVPIEDGSMCAEATANATGQLSDGTTITIRITMTLEELGPTSGSAVVTLPYNGGTCTDTYDLIF